MIRKLGFKKFTKVGVGSAVVLCLVCKLPWILALFGFTLLGSQFEQLSNYSLLVVLALIAITSGMALWIYRRYFRKALVQHDMK